MTRRERLEAVINGKITMELIEDCKRELEKLNAQGARLKETLTPQQEENQRIGEKILEIISDAGELQIEEIRDKLNEGLTRQRVTAICTNLIREGKLKRITIMLAICFAVLTVVLNFVYPLG